MQERNLWELMREAHRGFETLASIRVKAYGVQHFHNLLRENRMLIEDMVKIMAEIDTIDPELLKPIPEDMSADEYLTSDARTRT